MRKYISIYIPNNVDELHTLSGDILDKNTLDGASSLLSPLDMADMQAKHDLSVQYHAEAQQLLLDRENAVEQRNLALGKEDEQQSITPGTVLYFVTAIRFVLTGIYLGEERMLGDWGYVVNSSPKGSVSVVIPASAPNLISLARKIIAKHTADGVGSVLSSIDMTAFETVTDLAADKHNEARAIDRNKEKMFEQRNKVLGRATHQTTLSKGTLLNYVIKVRNLLRGHFLGEEQQMGDWGFEVNSTTGGTTPPTPEVATTVTGFVRNAVTQAALGEVEISFTTSAGQVFVNTDPVGNYEVVLVIPATELVTVQVNHFGYEPFNQALTVNFEQENTFDILLQPEPEI